MSPTKFTKLIALLKEVELFYYLSEPLEEIQIQELKMIFKMIFEDFSN